MHPKRVILLLGLLTLFGCSGLTSLVVINNTGEDATIHLRSHRPKDDTRKEQEITLRMEHGDRTEALSWFAVAPESIELEVNTAKDTRKQRFDRGTYPAAMARGSSGVGQYILEIGPDHAMIRPPTAYDTFIRDPGFYMLPVGFCSCLGIIALLIVWFARRAHLRRTN